MLKTIITVGFIILLALAGGAAAGDDYRNFELVINGTIYDLDLDEEIQVEGLDGESFTILLHKKPFTEYSDAFVSFRHRSDLSVSTQDLGSGISQLMLATATGTLVMVQEYSSMDPAMMVPMMLRELTKESVDYGYEMTQEEITRQTGTGETAVGLRAILTYRGEELYCEVLSHSIKDKGILIVTQIDLEYQELDQDLHDKFWKTLQMKY